jgi:hypothetical protein
VQEYVNPPPSPSRMLELSHKFHAPKSPLSSSSGKNNQYHGADDTDEINREYREKTPKVLDR